MTRHRAERLARLSRSAGFTSKALPSAPKKPNASTPSLWVVILKIPHKPVNVVTYNVRQWCETIRQLRKFPGAPRP